MTPSARSALARVALVPATLGVVSVMVYLLVGGALSGVPAITEPWDEARDVTWKIMLVVTILGGWLALAQRALGGAWSASLPREAARCACVGSLPVAATYLGSLPGGPVRSAWWGLRDTFLLPLEVVAPATMALLCVLITLGARSAARGRRIDGVASDDPS